MENVSRERYIAYQRQNGHPNLTTHSTGLVISFQNPWLAASPDDRVQDGDWGLAEYKNPYSARHLTISQACETLKGNFCLAKCTTNGQTSYTLKPRHDYYYQVQCQMYCDDKAWCDFVLCTEKDVHVQRVPRDTEWWKEQLSKLKAFYFHSLIPELACPRFNNGGIREFVEILTPPSSSISAEPSPPSEQ